MFRALTCPSSGGQFVLSQLLVSSHSVNGCTVCRMRADFSVNEISLYYDARSKNIKILHINFSLKRVKFVIFLAPQKGVRR